MTFSIYWHQLEMELCLTDMLVNLYNSKEQSQEKSVYEDLYIKINQSCLKDHISLGPKENLKETRLSHTM